MTIGFYTSKHYFDSKKASLEEAMKKLGVEAQIVLDNSFVPIAEQAYGFEELFKRTKSYAAKALQRDDFDIGIGVENSLSLIYSANEWFYSICIAVVTRDGRNTSSFTPGISIPDWMVKKIEEEHIKIDVLTERMAQENDPVVFFSSKTLTRKDLMVPAFLLAFSNLGLGKRD